MVDPAEQKPPAAVAAAAVDLLPAAATSRAASASTADPELQAAATLARWLDGRFLDPLLGLFLPGAGDILSAVLGLYPVMLAWRRRAPKTLLARMLLNLAVDALGGALPVLGDLWDFLFRAHARNLALLQARARGGEVRARASDVLVVAGAALLFVAALALPIAIAGAVARALFGSR